MLLPGAPQGFPRCPPTLLGPGAPVNCSPGTSAPHARCPRPRRMPCSRFSAFFLEKEPDRCEEESAYAMLGSGGRGTDAGSRLAWVPPADACDGAGWRQACGARVVWGPRWSPPLPPRGRAGLLAHPVCCAIPKRGHGRTWGARGKRGSWEECPCFSPGADTPGSGDPAGFHADCTPASEGGRLSHLFPFAAGANGPAGQASAEKRARTRP